jgi:hypothetical protein
MNTLTPREHAYHLMAFRQARATLLADSEAYIDSFVCLENLGRRLHPPASSFLRFKEHLTPVLANFLAPHASVVYPTTSELQERVKTLLNRLGDARNDAAHGGAYARHLGMGCIEASLIAEEALAKNMSTVSDFMVNTVAIAELWQPLAYARQVMLKNSFTWLPIETTDGWRLISAMEILRSYGSTSDKKSVLKATIEELIEEEKVALEIPTTTSSNEPVELARSKLAEQSGPLLVIDSVGGKNRLVGILMAFDLL